MTDLSLIWQDYGLDKLQEGISSLFPERQFSLERLFQTVMSGDIMGALELLFQGSISDFLGELAGMRNVFVWLLVLGIVSSLMTHFVEIFDRRQVADMGFYFMYLLFTAVLLKCFSQAVAIAVETVENILLFVKLMVPAYLLSVGVSSGAVTAGASYQMMILVVYGVEYVLSAGLLPLIYSFVMLVIINGIWPEEKLGLLIELVNKIIGWLLKGALGVVTGIGVFQALIAPVVDSARTSALQRLISAIPGGGNAAGGAGPWIRNGHQEQHGGDTSSASAFALCGSAAEDRRHRRASEGRRSVYGNCQRQEDNPVRRQDGRCGTIAAAHYGDSIAAVSDSHSGDCRLS